MTMVSSGEISLGYLGTYNSPSDSVSEEIGMLGQTEISMDFYACRNMLNIQPSGTTISMSNFYGKTHSRSVDVYILAGGGGGGTGMGGGGGGGGSSQYIAGLSISAGVWTVTVGSGGTNTSGYSSSNTAGGESSLVNSSAYYYDLFIGPSAQGGGRGGAGSGAGGDGGCGGGAGSTWSGEGPNVYLGGTGYPGKNGGNSSTSYRDRGAGGGGQNTAGSSPISSGGAGGSGLSPGIGYPGYGMSYYGAGGGGGAYGSSNGGAGGSNTGGTGGGNQNSHIGQNGTANGGGGGGGGSVVSGGGQPQASGNGGSGVVILRYDIAYPAAIATTGSPGYTTDASYRYYRFTGSGTITFAW